MRSVASSFKWEYPLLSLRSSSSFLHLLPRLLVTSISPFIFPSITCFRRQFLRIMWPIQLAFLLLISCRIFLCSLTLSNTSSFLTWSVQLKRLMVKIFTNNWYKGKRHKDHASYFLFPLIRVDGKKICVCLSDGHNFRRCLTLNTPSLARQLCLSSWGPQRTPWFFFCNFSTVWCGRLLKLCFLGFWNYNSVIQALLVSNNLCLFISTEVSQ